MAKGFSVNGHRVSIGIVIRHHADGRARLDFFTDRSAPFTARFWGPVTIITRRLESHESRLALR